MKIGWIGTGVMGVSMAGHLQGAGHALAVCSRTRAKAEPLLAAGAAWCDTPAEVAESAELVFTMVGFPQDVEAVYFGQGGLFSARGGARCFVDMTTSPPELMRRLAVEAAARGAEFLDAPVSGGDVGARNAALAIMVGGGAAAFVRALPLFKLMGKNIARLGPCGAGQHAKMCNQILIAGNMVGVCEALLYAKRAGLDAEAVVGIVSQGAAGSWSLSNLAPRILQGNFDPGFYVEHFIKDLGIALRESRAMGLKLPGLALAAELYERVGELGMGRRGTQALFLALEAMQGPA